jgi:hypothetical protein
VVKHLTKMILYLILSNIWQIYRMIIVNNILNSFGIRSLICTCCKRYNILSFDKTENKLISGHCSKMRVYWKWIYKNNSVPEMSRSRTLPYEISIKYQMRNLLRSSPQRHQKSFILTTWCNKVNKQEYTILCCFFKIIQ